MKMISYSHTTKTHFDNKGFAFSLVLKLRVPRIRKWPVKSVNLYEMIKGCVNGVVTRELFSVFVKLL